MATSRLSKGSVRSAIAFDMTELETIVGEDRAVIEVSERSYPRDAVYAAAFAFIDRSWVRLDRRGDGRLAISLRPKAALDLRALASEVEAELAAQALRLRVAAEGRAMFDDVLARAFGAPGAEPALEDPLGIAKTTEAS
jgi:His-Xaa-Ser system protein HxsD